MGIAKQHFSTDVTLCPWMCTQMGVRTSICNYNLCSSIQHPAFTIYVFTYLLYISIHTVLLTIITIYLILLHATRLLISYEKLANETQTTLAERMTKRHSDCAMKLVNAWSRRWQLTKVMALSGAEGDVWNLYKTDTDVTSYKLILLNWMNFIWSDKFLRYM